MKRLSILLIVANALLMLSTLAIPTAVAEEAVPTFCCQIDIEGNGQCCTTCECPKYGLACHVDSQCPDNPFPN